jgi:hypothetical protein
VNHKAPIDELKVKQLNNSWHSLNSISGFQFIGQDTVKQLEVEKLSFELEMA